MVIPILCACCASLMFSIYKFAPIYIDITKATFTPKTTFTVGLNVTNGTRATDSNSPGWKAIAVSTNDMCGKEKQKRRDKMPKGGFVFALSYYDQQISALGRVFNLQCWAAQNNMGVVEPFLIRETRLGVSIASEKDRMSIAKELKFSDIFDLQQWNKKASIPLTRWNTFLDTAPRDVIYVQIKWKTSMSKLPVPCSTDNMVENQVLEFLSHNKFRVCKKVCLDLHRYDHELSLKHLSNIVFGETRNLKVTVVISMWVGLNLDNNLACPARKFSYELKPSPGIINDGKEYIRRWLNGSNYIAVMVRLERIYISGKSVPVILDKVLKLWTKLKGNMKCNTTFLSLDVGRFGSKGTTVTVSKNAEYFTQSARSFFDSIYNNSISFHAWEDSLVNVSGTTESSYISGLQTSIAASARCVILVGGGNFQSRVLQLHKDRHKKNPCHYRL